MGSAREEELRESERGQSTRTLKLGERARSERGRGKGLWGVGFVVRRCVRVLVGVKRHGCR